MPVITTTPATTTTAETTTEVTVSRFPGDVDLNDSITITDALEILKYLAGLDNLIDKVGGRHLDNALILPTSISSRKPVIGDVLEILKYLAGLTNLIDN